MGEAQTIQALDWIARGAVAAGLLYILREVVREKPSWMPTWFYRETVDRLTRQLEEYKADLSRLLAIHEKQQDQLEDIVAANKELVEANRRMEAELRGLRGTRRA